MLSDEHTVMNLTTLENTTMQDNPFVAIDDLTFQECLHDVAPRLVSESEGYLGPDSISWKIFREPCVLLGGYRAVMLQMAHPAVAQGVEQSSSFRHDLIGRAKRTIQAMNGLVFGSQEMALKTAKMMHKIHHRVNGVVPEYVESTWAGKRFRANDPNLLDWVGLTTLDSVLTLFEILVRPLTAAEKEQFAYEAQTVALLCGLPTSHHRDSVDSFRADRDQMLRGNQLSVHEVAQGIVSDLFDFVPGSLDERLTLGLLPPAARELYGIEWSDARQADFDRLMGKVSFLNKNFPKALRYVPAYRQAKARVSRDKAKTMSNGSSLFKNAKQADNFYLRTFGFSESGVDSRSR